MNLTRTMNSVYNVPMDFQAKNVMTAVTADRCRLFTYGYFANDMESLRDSVTRSRICHKAVYDRLDGIHTDRFEHRFCCSCGNFALFYPTDRTENEMRY